MAMLNSSAAWQELVKDYIIVFDPDGWDRSPEGWEKSWNEQITFEEFMNRVVISTCQFTWNDCNSIEEIFKVLEKRVQKYEKEKS